MSHFWVSQEPLARLPATRSRPPFLPTSWVRKVRNSRRGRTSMGKQPPPPEAPGLARPRPEGCRHAWAREDMPRHAACALRMLRLAARRCVLVAIREPPSMVSYFGNHEEAAKVPAHVACLR